jgi:hypothetical protein
MQEDPDPYVRAVCGMGVAIQTAARADDVFAMAEDVARGSTSGDAPEWSDEAATIATFAAVILARRQRHAERRARAARLIAELRTRPSEARRAAALDLLRDDDDPVTK